ncbi:MAG: type IV secretion system protein [Pseudomonadota bacterium]
MRRLIHTTGAAVALLVAAPGGAALAQGIPVYDNANTVQAIQQVTNQLQQLEEMARDYAMQAEQYVELYNQTVELVAQTRAITGSRSMGEFLNGVAQFEGRRYVPEGYDEFLDLGSSTLETAAGAVGLVNDLRDAFDPITGAELDPNDPTGSIARAADRLTNVTYGTLAASEEVYNSITQRTEDIETMLARLNTSTDLKETADLTARIGAEQALIENETLRLRALQLQLDASEENEELMRLRQANRANVYDPTAAAAAMTLRGTP